MNPFRNSFLLIVLFCTLFLVNCTEPPQKEYSLVEKISRQWKISTLTIDGNVVYDTENFLLTLNKRGDKPATFAITTGGVAYNFAGSTSGSWSLLPNNKNPTQAIFDGNTVNFTASEEQLTIQYNGIDDASIRFVLYPR